MKKNCPGRMSCLLALLLAFLMVSGSVLAVITMPPLKAVADGEDVSGSTIDFDENIMLSVFWPPTPNYINDEQYQLMADAGINWVLGAGEETLATPANQKKMLELCDRYGMHLILQDGNFGGSLTGKSASAIARAVERYKDYQSLGGFYILDEPYNANGFVNSYLNLKKAFPNGYMHLNFLPSGSYGSIELYKAQMNDWCRLCAAGGYPVDYLIYDRYPFGLQPGSMDRNGFYQNLRAVHDVGLENGVRTGTYIQTVCQSVAFRRPTASEIRYEMYSALAFGFKQLSFFTWFTPVNRNEPFQDGIIAANGVPNAHYEDIKTINHEILAIGSILARCDAMEVYLNGETWGQPSIPGNFFAQPLDKNAKYTLSLLRHKETGRNYLMLVNNNFSKETNIRLALDASVSGISEVSRDDGHYIDLALEDHTLELTLSAGDGILLALPSDVDFCEKSSSEQPAATVNLAQDALIISDQSMGEGGYYISYLNDGQRYPEGSILGWRSQNGASSFIQIDLKQTRKFNRIDLYPEGNLFSYGESFPEDFSISISQNGRDFAEVVSMTGVSAANGTPSVRLSEEMEARYIRIDITKCRGTYAGLAEIEVYNDDGTVPAPKTYDPLNNGTVYDYKQGSDIALNKPVYPSSTTPDAGFRTWGWAADYINNGVDGQGWTSNVKRNSSPDSTEYMIIDFGDTYAVDRVDVLTMGCFPEDYRVELSVDGKEWTVIASETGAPNHAGGTLLSFTPEGDTPVAGRFLRFIGTRLRGTAADGYMLQLGNISAYGTPICDTSILTNAMNAYQAAGGDTSVPEYAACEQALAMEYLTQSRARFCAQALLALIQPEEEETSAPDTETATEPSSGADDTTSTTDADSAKGTTNDPAATDSEPDSTTAEISNGCSSTVTAASLILLGCVGALTFLRRKKQD